VKEVGEVVTKAEFRDWVESGASGNPWTIDEAMFRNRNVLLFYRSGPKGKFIRIDSNGTLTTGSYEDGIPHISNACFHRQFSKLFPSQKDAYKRVIEVGGVQFLLILFDSIPQEKAA
jgi:hypothetical protein